MQPDTRYNYIRKLVITGIWLLIWQMISQAISNEILLVGPVETIRTLILLLPQADFWRSIAMSSGKILGGFLAAYLSGMVFAALAVRFSLIEEFLSPVMTLFSSIPVASFVIIVLIWTSSANLCIVIVFMIVLPMAYTNIRSSLRSVDPKLLELAQVYHLSFASRISYLYRPVLLPQMIQSTGLMIGLSFKSGVAAEVIGVPDGSIGERLYMAKIYLSTGELFAWTIVIILLSMAAKYLFVWILTCFLPKSMRMKAINPINQKKGADA